MRRLFLMGLYGLLMRLSSAENPLLFALGDEHNTNRNSSSVHNQHQNHMLDDGNNIQTSFNDETDVPIVLSISPGQDADMQSIMDTVNNEVSLDTRNTAGQTTLMIPSDNRDEFNLYNAIVDSDNVDIQDSYGDTPLMHACYYGYENSIDKLIEVGVNVDIRNNKGQTALMLASVKGYGYIVNKLIAAGANVNLQDLRGNTAILFAINQFHESIVDNLIMAGADLNLKHADGSPALLFASDNGQASIVDKLIFFGANLNSQDYLNEYTALNLAIRNGNENIANKLITSGAILDKQSTTGLTVLMQACANELERTVDQLVTAGANLDIQDNDGNTALILAVDRENENLIDKLLAAGADVDKLGSSGTALMMASYRGDEKTVNKLIVSGANVNKQNKEGHSALIIASSVGHENIVDQLIAARAQLDIKNHFGYTALMASSYLNHKLVVDKLINAGANIDQRSGAGLAGDLLPHNDIINKLFKLNSNGVSYTALMLATKAGNIKIAEKLIAAGAKLDIKVIPEYTTISFSLLNKHSKLPKKLPKAGATYRISIEILTMMIILIMRLFCFRTIRKIPSLFRSPLPTQSNSNTTTGAGRRARRGDFQGDSDFEYNLLEDLGSNLNNEFKQSNAPFDSQVMIQPVMSIAEELMRSIRETHEVCHLITTNLILTRKERRKRILKLKTKMKDLLKLKVVISCLLLLKKRCNGNDPLNKEIRAVFTLFSQSILTGIKFPGVQVKFKLFKQLILNDVDFSYDEVAVGSKGEEVLHEEVKNTVDRFRVQCRTLI